MSQSVLWTHTKVGSWIASTNHKQIFKHYILGKITVLFEDYNYKNEVNHITIPKGGNFVVWIMNDIFWNPKCTISTIDQQNYSNIEITNKNKKD